MKESKSRKLRRVRVKLPSSKVKIDYRRKAPSKAVCGKCGAVLKGTPNKIPALMKKLTKSAKRPSRPYGGVLCAKCTSLEMKKKARSVKK